MIGRWKGDDRVKGGLWHPLSGEGMGGQTKNSTEGRRMGKMLKNKIYLQFTRIIHNFAVDN